MTHPGRIKDFFKMLCDNMQVGIIVADVKGVIIYLNGTYARFLNINIEDSLGKHACDIVANSRLHIVAETGQAEINYPHQFNNVSYLVHRIPIRHGGKVIAVLGLILFDNATTAVKLAEKLVHLETELRVARNELASLHAVRYSFTDIVSRSAAMEANKRQGLRAAGSELPVLITGESGTGKEMFAQSIHRHSARAPYPFVRVNCAAIPRELFESELFGYEKGAFTGAHPKGKAGKFELANLGTIFLDEVGDMPMELQPKLLRVLELKEFERVGGNRLSTSDFRVIAATNLDLEKEMNGGRFRRDLFYRLNGISLHIPPLRSRREDIGLLAEHFLRRIVTGTTPQKVRIDQAAQRQLQAYSWPGNARELLHVLEQAAFAMSGNVITPLDLPDYIRTPLPSPPPFDGKQHLKTYIDAAERHAIEHALMEANHKKSAAAAMLGIHRTLLHRKMQKLGMSGEK